ncbi:unnamed protein product [Lactuca virosa]|uniref:Peptidase A1 domain-containing protein n=1 Tax=Lactuca virosa TaxID=75947 RepID=A0AAU9LLS8_9ASTR|nr:unnamed protein product [Lactuca virosa]
MVLLMKHPNMVPHLLIIVLLLAFISHEPEAIAQFLEPYPYTSQVAPLRKHADAATPLYSIQMEIAIWVYIPAIYKNFIIDIDAPFTWHDCTVDWNSWIYESSNCFGCTHPTSCEEYACTDVRTSYSYESPSCLPITNSSTLPGSGDCICPVNVVNPVNKTCGHALLNYDTFTFRASDGKNPFLDSYECNGNAACAPSSMFESFPANVSGVMAFSSSRKALPALLFQPFNNTFALCLPSSLSAHGVMFFGSGPYYLLPKSDVDLRSLLSYTPLLNHTNSFGYFIGIKSITVKGRSIDVSKSTTKLSTIDSYTILRADIYKQVVRMFSVATLGILRARPVAPFAFCLKNRIGHSLSNLKMPDIVLKLQGGKKWRISSSNSMQQVRKDVACLAFVNGGATSEYGIVIGTFQMENNFLLFDLDNSTFGFSSSLLSHKTSCSNFNFTTLKH